MTYLLDSDIIIKFLKNDPQTVRKIKSIQNQTLGVSVISIGEILEGLLFPQYQSFQESFFQFLKNLKVYPVDGETMTLFAQLRFDLRKKGQLIDDFDLIIAATTLKENLTLISDNQKHFARIPKLKLKLFALDVK